MSVETNQPFESDPPGPPDATLPPELRYDGAGLRALDVVIAIQSAHQAGAHAGSVATVKHPGHSTLTVKLYATSTCVDRASAAQADAVLRAFDIPVDRIARIYLPGTDGAWLHTGITDDGLIVEIFALGPIGPTRRNEVAA